MCVAVFPVFVVPCVAHCARFSHVLQCVAACVAVVAMWCFAYSALQCVAVCWCACVCMCPAVNCSELQSVAVCAAVCCSVLQYVSVCVAVSCIVV